MVHKYLTGLYSLVLLLFTQVALGQAFTPKPFAPIKLLKQTATYNNSIRFDNLFTYPAGLATTTDLSTVATVTVTSTNPPLLQANGTTYNSSTRAFFVRYSIAPNVTGTARLNVSIVYNGVTSTTAVDVAVSNVLAVDDAATVAPGQFVLVDVLANDQPLASLNPASLTVVTAPGIGTATIVVNGSRQQIRYAAPASAVNYSSDVLTYQVADQSGNIGTAQVVFSVQYSAYATRLLEYKPAPGQFINATPYGTLPDAQNVLGAPNSSIVSLGGYGGYVVVGFDQPIRNNPQNPYGVDFTVRGNAFASWTEPGAVQVMQDTNGNGLPDDTWYELAGSEYHFNSTHKVAMTYQNPRFKVAKDVIWTTNANDAGVLRSNTFHRQPYYPLPELFANVNPDQETYGGSRINIRVNRSNPSYITSGSFRFGYADNKPNNATPTIPKNPYTTDANGASADGFDISWAVAANGNPVTLSQVDFVKVYNAAQEDAGALGETSTEVESISITTPDPTYVPQDYYVNLIGVTPFQVLLGTTQQLQGILFKNGLPQSASATWSVSNAATGSVSATGLFSANALGSTYVYFRTNTGVKRDSVQLEVIDLRDVFVSTNNPTLYVGEQGYVHAESVDQRAAPANRYVYDQYTFSVNNAALATVSNTGIVTAKAVGVVTVTATSQTNPTLSKSLQITVSQAPPVVARYSQLTYNLGVGQKTIALDTVYTVTGNGQAVNRLSVSGNSNRALVTATVSRTNQLQLAFAPGVVGTATLSIASTAYGTTQTFPLVVRVLPQQQPVKDKQVVFVNGGQFGGKQGNVQSYNPATNLTTKVADFTDATSVQAVVTVGKYAYVSADYNILKYDLTTNTEVARRRTQDLSATAADGQGQDGAGVNHSMARYKDWLIATRQNSGAAPEDGYNVRIYRQQDLSLVAKIPVSTEAAGVAVVGDSAFVALNGGYLGTSGQIAIIDLINLTLKQEYNLGVDGTGIMQLLPKRDTLVVLAEEKMLTYAIKTNTHQLHTLPIGHADYSSSPLAAAIVGNTLYSKLNWGAYPGENKGFGTVSLRNFAVTQNDLIGMNTTADPDIQGLMLMASAYDTEDQRFYITFGQWFGNGTGRIYSRTGTPVGSFGNVEDSPERMAISYAVVNKLPYLTALIAADTVHEQTTRQLPLSNYFRDDDQPTLQYTATLVGGGVLPAWLTLSNGVFTATPPTTGAVVSLPISVTATDEYNATVNQTFNLVVIPVGTPLPVELVAFTATAKNQDALLAWTTASEKNNDHFDVERSLDGTRFGKIDEVKGQGSSTRLTNYTRTDAGIATKATGLVYYRLKQVDADGTSTYSPVRTVRFGPVAPAIALFPNPANSVTQLDLRALPTGTYQVSVLDATGRVVIHSTLEAGLTHTLDLHAIASGSYTVLVRGGTGSQVVNLAKRLVKE